MHSYFTALLFFYNYSTGYFGNPDVAWPFWTSGVALEATAEYYKLSNDSRAYYVLLNSFSLVRKDYEVPCDPDQPGCVGNDDIQWHAHAWLSAYDATNNTDFLAEALKIYSTLLGPWHSYNESCGGMNWAMNPPYVNTVTNGLFHEGLVRLWRAGQGDALLGGRPVREWARIIYSWSQHPGLLSPQGVLLDGLSEANCSVAVGDVWSYNQGLWLSSLATYSLLQNNDTAVLLQSQRLSEAATLVLSSPTDPQRIMREVSCSLPEGWCDDYSGQQFKGVFSLRLGRALLDWELSGLNNHSAVNAACSWLAANSQSLLERGSGLDSSGHILFGQLWQGPYTPQLEKTPWVAHSAGFQLLIANISCGRINFTRLH